MTAICPPDGQLSGYGTLLQYCEIGATEWTTVGGTKDLEFPPRTTEALETTSNDGPEWKTFIPSKLKEVGTFSNDFDFIASQHKVLNAMHTQGLTLRWRLITSDESYSIAFCAFIISIGESSEMEGLVTDTLELRPTGAPEYAYGFS